jgi:heme/copper-type cytochrome/quinol oxidase subunit 2
MKALSPIGKTLQVVSLALMIGGIISVGAIVAPTVFHNIQQPQAAQVMALIFGKLNTVLLAATGALVLGTVLGIMGKRCSKKAESTCEAEACEPKKMPLHCKISLAALIVVVTLGLYTVTSVVPRMIELQSKTDAASQAEFNGMHKKVKGLYQGQAGAAAILLVLLAL